MNARGLEQLAEVFSHLVKQAGKALPVEYAHLGKLISIDGSLIDAVSVNGMGRLPKRFKKSQGSYRL